MKRSRHVRPLDRFPDWLVNGAFTTLLGSVLGGIAAGVLIATGLIGAGIAFLAGGAVGTDGMLRGLLFYLGGFVVGGAVAGALWPVRRWIGGRYGLGIVVASFVMIAISLFSNGPFSGWKTFDWIVIVFLSVVFGAGVPAVSDEES